MLHPGIIQDSPVRPGVDAERGKLGTQKPKRHRIWAVANRDYQNNRLDSTFDNLQDQEGPALPNSLDCVQICQMHRGKGIDDAENAQIRHCRKPLRGHGQPYQRFGARGKTRHGRHYQKTAEHDSPARHLAQTFFPVLFLCHRRQQDAVHRCHNKVIRRIWVVLTLFKEGHLCVSFGNTDNQRIDFLIPHVQQRRAQQLYSIMEQAAKPLP